MYLPSVMLLQLDKFSFSLGESVQLLLQLLDKSNLYFKCLPCKLLRQKDRALGGGEIYLGSVKLFCSDF